MQQPGQHVSGPAGYANGGQVHGFPIGSLLGRIGEEGAPFVIGNRVEGRTAKGGRLYLFVVPVQEGGGQGSKGTYQVKVATGAELVTGKKTVGSTNGISSRWTNSPATASPPSVPVPVPVPPPPPPPIAPPAPANPQQAN
jgi:hypothetical protein